MNRLNLLLILVGVSLLSACSPSRHVTKATKRQPQFSPKNIEDACEIMQTHPTWYRAFVDTHQKYGAPPHVVMAILYQESRFVPDARPSSGDAYGYAQALDATWKWYKDKTGRVNALRDHLPDAVDFVGWYIAQNQKRTSVSKWDARDQYLAYHEGTGGYLNDSHHDKAWLLAVAEKVNDHAILYRKQLANCYVY